MIPQIYKALHNPSSVNSITNLFKQSPSPAKSTTASSPVPLSKRSQASKRIKNTSSLTPMPLVTPILKKYTELLIVVFMSRQLSDQDKQLIREWIEKVTGEKYSHPDDPFLSLKDGVLLCGYVFSHFTTTIIIIKLDSFLLFVVLNHQHTTRNQVELCLKKCKILPILCNNYKNLD